MSSRFYSPSDIAHPYEYSELPAEMCASETYSSNETPALRSSLSLLYHAHFTIDPEFEDGYDPQIPHIVPNPATAQFLIELSIRGYMNDIMNIQYPFGDHSIPDMIWGSMNAHPPSHEAVALLSQLYSGQRDQMHFTIPDAEDRISRLQAALSRAQFEDRLSADDGMTALHIVLYYLLAGGRGRWNEFLMFACHYARKVLENPSFMHHYPTALEAAPPKDQFVVKTAIWFDVLASITTRRPPQLLLYIRALFKPDNSSLGMPTTCSMMMPMGCENTVVWALAETSNLSYWKRRCEENGDLSVDKLVQRVREIEPYLADPILPIGQLENCSRFLASEIFRTSTKLFLKSVESGDFPHVQEIRDSVFETIDAIQDFLKGIGGGGIGTDNRYRSAMRSTRFGSYICGSLTDNRGVLRELTTYLESNMAHEGVGNCADVMHLLAEIHYTKLASGPRRSAPWRKQLVLKGVLLI